MTALDSAPASAGFEHEALFYRGPDGFLAGVLPFVREGLARDEAVVVAEPRDRLDQLRQALGEDAERVDLLDMADVGANPSRIIAVWAAAVELHIGFQALARVSMTRNTKVRDVAEELVRTGALPDGRGTP